MLSTRTQVVGWTLGVASLVGPGPILGRISAGQPPAAESGDSKPLGGTRDLIARLPASVTLAVSIDSAARHRESAPGRALWAFVDDAKLMHRTRSAWNELASSLGLTPEQAFDQLLGRRAIFVLSGANPDGRARWAIMSEVTPSVEKRVRLSLSPAPRSIERGRPILSLERGAYELATTAGRPGHLQPPGAPTDELLLLAPSEDSQLFDEILAVLAGKIASDPIGKAPAWAHTRALKAGDVFVWCESPGLLGSAFTTAPAEPQTGGFMVLSAHATPRGWAAEFVSSPTLAVWDSEHAEILPAGIAAIERGAMFSYAGTLPLNGESGTPELRKLAGMIWPEFPNSSLEALGPPVVLALHPQAQGLDADSPTQIALSLAVRTSDVRNTAQAADLFISRAVNHGGDLTRASSTNATTTDHGFSNFEPWQTRTLERCNELSQSVDGGPDATVTWACFPDVQRGESHKLPGWWLTGLTLGPGPAGTAGARLDLLRSITQTHDPDPSGIVSRLLVRPSLILQTLSPRAQAMPDSMRALRWFELISSECFLPREGIVNGRIEIEMAVPPPSPAIDDSRTKPTSGPR